ncbi:MAG: lytic transglycosylase F [Acidobacteria bacterium]|nr:lytic transglycosylase F [Acidobacteriota bacterium]
MLWSAGTAVFAILLLFGCGGSPAGPGEQPAAAPATETTAHAAEASAADYQDPVIAPIMPPWTGDHDGMVKRRYIRALVPYSKTYFFIDRGDQRGIATEMLREFQKVLNQKLRTRALKVHVVAIPVRRDQLIQYLIEGRGDLALGNLTVIPERQELVDFSDPAMTGVQEVVVTGPAGPDVRSLDDLASREVWVRTSSSYWEHLQAVNAERRETKQPEILLRAADEQLEDEDILEMVNAGLLPATVVDSHLARFWVQIYPDIRVHETLAVNTGGDIAAAFRKGSPGLAKEVNAFVKSHKMGTLFANTLLQRSLKDTRWIKNSTNEREVKKFKALVALLQKYAGQYDFDWLMIAAQAYQESGLDQGVRSPVGAIGVMQVMPTTARSREVNIPDIEKEDRNIHAGVKYMRFMMDEYFKDAPMDRINKGLFAFACYNAGPNRIARLQKEATAAGLDPNKWFHNVEIIVVKRVGRETVTYVSNIYKYYLAFKLVQERMNQRQKVQAAAGNKEARFRRRPAADSGTYPPSESETTASTFRIRPDISSGGTPGRLMVYFPTHRESC